MAKPSVSIPDELLDEFDAKIDEKRRSGEMDLDTTRSEVVQNLMREWLEGNLNLTSKKSKPKPTAD